VKRLRTCCFIDYNHSNKLFRQNEIQITEDFKHKLKEAIKNLIKNFIKRGQPEKEAAPFLLNRKEHRVRKEYIFI
jgi:hypothetical protein